MIKKIQFLNSKGELSEYVRMKKNINIFLKYLKPKLFYLYKWKELKYDEIENNLTKNVKDYDLIYDKEI